METLRSSQASASPVQVVLFDFDGTISTLRTGWEEVMRTVMFRYLSHGQAPSPALRAEIDAYIEESTGIQTIYQMKWLAEKARALRPDAPADPWFYKEEYNRELMKTVALRREKAAASREGREAFLIAGAEAFLQALRAKGVRLMVASGTDHPDVQREAAALGLDGYFQGIFGAPVGQESCSKEKIIRQLLEEEKLSGDALAVIGDGKVEIQLGRAVGARAVGMATDEQARRGVNPAKRARLIRAGADVICGDFTESAALLRFLGLATNER